MLESQDWTAEFDGGSIRALTSDLCAIPARIAGAACTALFERLARELPLQIHAFDSGSEFNGWVVPDDWRVERATIHRDGELVFDGSTHPLAVASYSNSFSGELALEALDRHLVSYPHLPEAYAFHGAWQYRPWDADWAICMPHAVRRSMTPGTYRVDLRTVRSPAAMLVGEFIHHGRSDREIVFNAHTCHPGQANDDMAGVAVLVHLARWLRDRDTRFTYRFVFGPEHLGTVFLLGGMEPDRIDAMVGGVFAEMPGTSGPLKLAASFRGDQLIDRVLTAAMRERGARIAHVGWRQGAGNDETVWEAPGYEVPFVELSRSLALFEPYREYHSSLDTPALLEPAQLEEFADVLARSVEILETNVVMHRRFDGIICLSNPAYDLYFERPDPTIDKGLDADSERWGSLLDSLLRSFDGDVSLLDIALGHDLPYRPLLAYLGRFAEKGLVDFTPAPAERPAAHRVGTSPQLGEPSHHPVGSGAPGGRQEPARLPVARCRPPGGVA